ncbi:MAG: penicillin-binding protein 1A [Gammaproteobacteria bacterium]
MRYFIIGYYTRGGWFIIGAQKQQGDFVIRVLWRLVFIGALLVGSGACAAAIAVAVIYQKLPTLEALEDYRPLLPLRVYTIDGVLIGEFGEEKRAYRGYGDFPPMLVEALLATEDARFFSHRGLDLRSVARAVAGYFGGRREGASTITMQVARNFYLKPERTILRKLTEIILALEIERRFDKKAILERYMNQIYLGGGNFGFAAASRSYYAKVPMELTLAEIAVLAGLPQAPSRYNPRRNPSVVKERQTHVLARMLANNLIDEQTYLQVSSAPLPPLRLSKRQFGASADYVAEEVRRVVYDYFGEDAYQRGFRVYTTVHSRLQKAAVAALREGLLAHESRRQYKGPRKFLEVRDLSAADAAAKLQSEPSFGGLMPAVVMSADGAKLRLAAKDGEEYVINAAQLGKLAAHLPKASGGKKPQLAPGAVVMLSGGGDDVRLSPPPSAEGALVALSPDDGAILALAGGFDFRRNQYNHATQARRQPGSALKPFIYSAALEKGFTSASILPDTPVFLSAEQTGSGKSWQPKNYDGKASGDIPLRVALAKSKNMATIKLLQSIGVDYARDYLLRFGFRRDDLPPYLTLGLGAAAVTPMELARGYAVFANGGYRVHPYLIVRVEDYDGNTIVRELNYQQRRRAIDARNAFVMTGLLQNVVREGTGRQALSLGRNDVAGKTGTTNNTRDAWFAGFGGGIVAAAWVGYDQLRSLGTHESGGRAALPVWNSFMARALSGAAEIDYLPPPGVVAAGVDAETGKLSPKPDARREYFYEEYLPLPGGEETPEGLF